MIHTLHSLLQLTSLATMSRHLPPLHLVNSELVLPFHLPASIPNNYVITIFCSCICAGAGACALALHQMSHQIKVSIRFFSFFRSVHFLPPPSLWFEGTVGNILPGMEVCLNFAALFTMTDLRDGCCCVCVCVCGSVSISIIGWTVNCSPLSIFAEAPLGKSDKDTMLFLKQSYSTTERPHL